MMQSSGSATYTPSSQRSNSTLNSKGDVNLLFKNIESKMLLVEQAMHQLLDSQVASVNSGMLEVFKSGGKRLRAILTLFVADLIQEFILTDRHASATPDTSRLAQTVPQVAACIELLHNASLLHDDVIDNADLRRNTRCFHKTFGNSLAILTGDVLYSKALLILAGMSDPKIVEAAARATLAMSESEILQRKVLGDFAMDENDYEFIIAHKTAVLIGEACRMTGLLYGLPEKICTHLFLFGKNLGMAFQLIDDALDYQQVTDVLGKKDKTDLSNGVITWPLLSIRPQLSEDEYVKIKEYFDHFRNPTAGVSNSIISSAEILQLIQKYNGVQATIIRAEKHKQMAIENLATFKDCGKVDPLYELAELIVMRTY